MLTDHFPFGKYSSWLPLDLLDHCLAHTECKLVILDLERADLLQPVALQLLQKSTITTFLVSTSSSVSQSARSWQNPMMPSMEEVMEGYSDDGSEILQPKISIEPEDNATIIFTSGIYIEYLRTNLHTVLFAFSQERRVYQKAS